MVAENDGLESSSSVTREQIAWRVFSLVVKEGAEAPGLEQLLSEISMDAGEAKEIFSDLDGLYAAAVTSFSERVFRRIQTGLIVNRSPYSRMNALVSGIYEACTEIVWEVEPTPDGWGAFEELEKAHGKPIREFLTLYIYKVLSESDERECMAYAVAYNIGQNVAKKITEAISRFMSGQCDPLKFRSLLRHTLENAAVGL